MANTPESSANGPATSAASNLPTFTPAEMAKANECFRRAQDLVNMKNFDYAIELYISGLEHWPEAIDEGHKPCRAASLFRGKVKLPFGSSMKWSTSGKDAKKAMLNAETLLSKEPQNIAYMEALFKNAEKAGYVATAMWIGEIYADAAVREAKPVDRLKTLHEVYGRISDRAKDSDPRLAITAMERALDAITKLRNLKPTDGVVANTLRDTAGKLTILKGNYSKAESFRESVHDTEGQKEIYDKDRLIQADERVDELIAVAQTRYEANPTDQRFINDLVDLLCRRENEADEKRAIKVLLDTHKATTDYRYKSRAYDIRIKQNRRAIRALRDGSNEEKLKAAEKEALQFELQVFRDRIKNYPTDMRLRYEYGRRLFEAGNYDEAIPYLQDARADRKVRYHCSLYVGRCFYKKNYYAQAIDTFREALGTYEMPDDDLGKQLNYWLGRSLEADSRTEEALKIYGQLIQWDYNYRKGDVRERIDALRGN